MIARDAKIAEIGSMADEYRQRLAEIGSMADEYRQRMANAEAELMAFRSGTKRGLWSGSRKLTEPLKTVERIIRRGVRRRSPK